MNTQTDTQPFEIFSDTTIHFDWKDRLKILIGKEVKVHTTISVTQPVGIISSGASIEVKGKTKYRKYSGLVSMGDSNGKPETK